MLRDCAFISKMEKFCGEVIDICKNESKGFCDIDYNPVVGSPSYSAGQHFSWQKEWLNFPQELNRKPLNLEIITETGFKTILEDGQVNVCFEAFSASKDDLEHFTDVLEASLGKDALVTYFKNRFDLYDAEQLNEKE